MSKNKTEQYRKRLLRLLKRKALKRGKVVLSSGKVSDYYLDGRLITLSPQGAYLAASVILDLIKNKKIAAIGGPTLGADPIVGAAMAIVSEKGRRLSGFIVRKSTKKHGMQRLIEGPPLPKGSRVVLVDDVATTGGSLVEAKKALNKQGVKVDCAIVIIDREEGAAENLARAGCSLVSLFKKRDIL
ncbi:MAG: orotate phosphoribosyltransferase [Candidatus Omnitrophota bacterium]